MIFMQKSSSALIYNNKLLRFSLSDFTKFVAYDCNLQSIFEINEHLS